MIRAMAVLALLFAEGLQNQLDCAVPVFIKGSVVAGSFPVAVRQPDGVAGRVNFPFAFVNAAFHLGEIVFPLAQLVGIFVKGVRIRIQKNVACLAVDDAGD